MRRRVQLRGMQPAVERRTSRPLAVHFGEQLDLFVEAVVGQTEVRRKLIRVGEEYGRGHPEQR